MTRKAEITRKTAETDIRLSIELDGEGKYSVQSPAHFLNHMLELFSKHGLFDLTVQASGDSEIDLHHTVEDIGICLGDAVDKALGDKAGIKRYGTSTVPMDEALATAVVDLSGRPFLVYEVEFGSDKVGEFDLELFEEFFKSFAVHARANVHIVIHHGKNAHHMAEACFKAFARSLSDAVRIDPRIKGVLSTKGKL
jgi:imidazoleglycerol-phosphate dehydratase